MPIFNVNFIFSPSSRLSRATAFSLFRGLCDLPDMVLRAVDAEEPDVLSAMSKFQHYGNYLITNKSLSKGDKYKFIKVVRL